MSSLIQPAMTFHGQHPVRPDRRRRWAADLGRGHQIGDMQAMIQYARRSRAAHPHGVDGHDVPVRHRLARAGARTARRRRAERRASADRRPAAGDRPVVFDDVHFSYVPDQPLIEGLDLIVEPGQTIAIVGPTGAGKTTLVNLIMRFYDLDSGTISLDGRDIAVVPARRAALESRHGPAGHVAVRRNDPREPRLRQPRCQRRRRSVEAARVTYVDRFVRLAALTATTR